MNMLLECTRHDKFSRSTTLPPAFSHADGELFNAAYDHALIGWALCQYDTWEAIIIHETTSEKLPWNPCIMIHRATYTKESDKYHEYHAINQFGLPVLTDDLRARLIAEMEGAA